MSKSIYIPKGQDCRMANLTCDNLLVDGSLRVDGEIRTKHIRGNGFISATAVFAKTITFNTLDCGMIYVGRLTAEHVTAVDIHVIDTMTVALFAKAISVRAGKVRVADAEIQNMYAETSLPPKRNCAIGYRLVSSCLAMLIARRCRLSQRYMLAEDMPSAEEPAKPEPSEVEARELMNDPEFLRLRAMYKLATELGYIWQLIPKQGQTDRVVIADTRRSAA